MARDERSIENYIAREMRIDDDNAIENLSRLLRDHVYLSTLCITERFKSVLSILGPLKSLQEVQKNAVARTFIPHTIELGKLAKPQSPLDQKIFDLSLRARDIISSQDANSNISNFPCLENCEICDEEIPFDNISNSKCKSGHIFSK